MTEKKETWTVTVELTVFAGNMSKENVEENAAKLLEDLIDGTDFVSAYIVDAKRDE